MKQIVKMALCLASLILIGLRLLGCSDASFVETTSEYKTGDATGTPGEDTPDGEVDAGGPDGVDYDPHGTGDPDDPNDPNNPNFQPDPNNLDNLSGVDPANANQPPLTETQIKERCKSSETQTRKVAINFPNPAKQCVWGANANMDLIQGVVTARHEAEKDLVVGTNEVICGMRFTFAQQEIRYDDEISLLFNGRFLMHSVENDIRYFEKKDGFYVYDWSRFVGKPYNANYSSINDYCIGAEEGKGSCLMPPTETNGIIKLEFDEDVTFKLSALADKERRGVFTWVTTGDNDPGTDCQHMDIAFDVELMTAKK